MDLLYLESWEKEVPDPRGTASMEARFDIGSIPVIWLVGPEGLAYDVLISQEIGGSDGGSPAAFWKTVADHREAAKATRELRRKGPGATRAELEAALPVLDQRNVLVDAAYEAILRRAESLDSERETIGAYGPLMRFRHGPPTSPEDWEALRAALRTTRGRADHDFAAATIAVAEWLAKQGRRAEAIPLLEELEVAETALQRTWMALADVDPARAKPVRLTPRAFPLVATKTPDDATPEPWSVVAARRVVTFLSDPTNPDWTLREGALDYLVNMRAYGAEQPVRRILAHAKDPKARLAAAKALETLGTNESIPGLLDALLDADSDVTAAAAKALAAITQLPLVWDATKSPDDRRRARQRFRDEWQAKRTAIDARWEADLGAIEARLRAANLWPE